ncbi:MAG: amino acid-binding protein [Antricoccus sp.]
MAYLLRVVLSDRPGSLGALASAIGLAGGDIISVDIVDKEQNRAVDDIVVDLEPGLLPDSIMSAAQALDGVRVESIRPFDGALATHRELQLIDDMAAAPVAAFERLIEEIPRIFRSGWAVLIAHDGSVLLRSEGAPDQSKALRNWQPVAVAAILDPSRIELPSDWTVLDTSLIAAPSDAAATIVAGRPGGPDFRPSEVARMAHLVGIARSIYLRFEQAGR